jgi:Flp pilus assembly protein TadG
MPRSVFTILRDLGPNSDGAVLIEFALGAVPCVTILFGIFEVGLMIVEGSVVEGATREAARKVRTGAVQSSADPVGTFKAE